MSRVLPKPPDDLFDGIPTACTFKLNVSEVKHALRTLRQTGAYVRQIALKREKKRQGVFSIITEDWNKFLTLPELIHYAEWVESLGVEAG